MLFLSKKKIGLRYHESDWCSSGSSMATWGLRFGPAVPLGMTSTFQERRRGKEKKQQLITDVFYPLKSRKLCLSAALFIGLLAVNKSRDI